MKKLPRISEAEWEVLSVLWRTSPLTASKVFAALSTKAWKMNTVRTFLTRLAQKGLVTVQESTVGHLFAPAIDREACVQAASRSFLQRVFEGATGSLLVHFARSERLTPAELAELEAILSQKRKGK